MHKAETDVDEDNSGAQKRSTATDAVQNLSTVSGLQGEEQPKLEASEPKKTAHRAGDKARRVSQWIRQKAEYTGLHDWLMVVFTGVLTLVAIGQGVVAYQNSQSSTAQISKIIDATNRIEDAADSFSGSALHINDGISNAVGKLNLQATTLGRQADQTRRLADETVAARTSAEKQAESTLQLDQRAWVGLTHFQNIAIPASPNVRAHQIDSPIVKNSGRTPANKVEVVFEVISFNAVDGDDFESAINNSAWMARLIDASISKELDGRRMIANRPQRSAEWDIELDDPSFFFPNADPRMSLDPPTKASMGVIPPDMQLPLDVVPNIRNFSTGNAKVRLIIFGKVTYLDFWGVERETIFCNYTHDIDSEDFKACPVYNDMK